MKMFRKLKGLSWYVIFVAFKQFQREKSWTGYIIANIFNSLLWILAWLYFANILYATNFSLLSYIAAITGIRCLGAHIEKYIMPDTGYHLQTTYPLNNFELAYLRFVDNILQPSEWVYMACLAYVVSINTNGLAVFVFSFIALLILIGLVEQLFALVSAKIHSLSFPSLFMWGLIAGCFYIAFAAINKKVPVSPYTGYSMLLLLVGSIFALTFSSNLYLLARFRRIRWRKNRTSFLSKTLERKMAKPSALKLLIIKELILIFKHKRMLLVAALSYPIITLLWISETTYQYSTCVFFIISFASLYGFNYLGHEEEAFILPQLSPVDRNTIIRAKNIAFMTVAPVGTLFVAIAIVVRFQLPVTQVFDWFVVLFFTLMVMTISCSYISVRNYTNNNLKKKYILGNIIYAIGSLIFISILYELTQLVPVLSGLFKVFTLAITLVTINFCIVNPAVFSRMLIKKERKILNSLST